MADPAASASCSICLDYFGMDWNIHSQLFRDILQIDYRVNCHTSGCGLLDWCGIHRAGSECSYCRTRFLSAPTNRKNYRHRYRSFSRCLGKCHQEVNTQTKWPLVRIFGFAAAFLSHLLLQYIAVFQRPPGCTDGIEECRDLGDPHGVPDRSNPPNASKQICKGNKYRHLANYCPNHSDHAISHAGHGVTQANAASLPHYFLICLLLCSICWMYLNTG